MVDVICDTSFLIHLATKRIINYDNLDVEIGQLSFVIPNVVRNELIGLKKDHAKRQDADRTLDFIKKFRTLEINGTFADKEILDYISKNRVIVATVDRELKRQVKSRGSSVLSLFNDRIVLEP